MTTRQGKIILDNSEYFNQQAPAWDNMIKYDTAKLTQIVALADLHNGQAVLDVGTGTGIMLPLLREKVGPAGRVAAIDIAPEMLRRAQAKFGSLAEFFLADASALPFPDASFDRVMCFSVFPHFTDKAKALRELARVLKPGGTILVAHAEGRESLNAFHKALNDFVASHQLPPDEEMISLGALAGLKTEFAANGEDLYAVKFGK